MRNNIKDCGVFIFPLFFSVFSDIYENTLARPTSNMFSLIVLLFVHKRVRLLLPGIIWR